MDSVTKGRAIIEETYRRIWKDWFGSPPGVKPATFLLRCCCADSGYRPERAELHLNLPEADVEEAACNADLDHKAAPPNGAGWPAWKRELVHEMLHEYEYKVLRQVSSAEGRVLAGKYSHTFGPGHGAAFFTAIHEKARYFGIPRERLVENV